MCKWNIFNMEKCITTINMLMKNQNRSEKCLKYLAYLLETQVNHEKFLKIGKFLKNFVIFY